MSKILKRIHMLSKGLKAKKIFERNKDTGAIRSRKPMDYGNEVVEATLANDKIDAIHYDIQHKVRKEVLNELWAANKVNHKGHWYIRLTDVVNIIGDDSELYENESRS